MIVYTRCHDRQTKLHSLAKQVRAGTLTRDEAFAQARELAAARASHRTKGDKVHKGVTAVSQGVDLSYLWRKQG
jgi:uncharacterized coiled-coil DUF342 family protein